MTHRTGGTKRSSRLTFRRRLLLVRLLLRSPLTGAHLIEAVHQELGDEGYPEAAESALKHDFDALKGEYGCQIRYQRSTQQYVLEDLGDLALLDLPDQCMEALAFLEASFPAGAALPEHAYIRELLERVTALLPSGRRAMTAQQTGAIRLQLPASPSERIDAATLATVRRAIARRQELQFDYLSTFDTDTPRRHRVAPYLVFFRPEGHGYLDATLLEVTPSGNEIKHSAIHYRLDRIVPRSARVLPTMLPPQRIAPPSYLLRYRLLPVVARRRDIAVYFPNTQIEYQQDGSAIVSATVTNLWQTRQVLLRYGTACEVLEPAELVELFRRTAAGLGEIYGATMLGAE
ncbi:transcriptional regulator [Kouleothrix aurantiaca]|uniref:Transcriptional regulator n=1 Tax=Kouleothrix aurantiaca TaxID=186479 RepID=A0A0P9HEX3_9CHLR|nr:transcriptional regulator [Kouleothrix aurantiaca]